VEGKDADILSARGENATEKENRSENNGQEIRSMEKGKEKVSKILLSQPYRLGRGKGESSTAGNVF